MNRNSYFIVLYTKYLMAKKILIEYVAIAPGNSPMLKNMALDREYTIQVSPEYLFMSDLATAIENSGYR